MRALSTKILLIATNSVLWGQKSGKVVIKSNKILYLLVCDGFVSVIKSIVCGFAGHKVAYQNIRKQRFIDSN